MAQIPGNPRVVQYTAVEDQTVFIYDFKIYDDDEIIVQSGDTTLTLTTDYTVQDAGEEAGGTITLVVGATVDTIITLTGNSMIERDTTFTEGGDFLASAINGEYDKLDDISKEIVTDQGQNFRLAVYSDTVSATIPNPVARRCLVWNSDGDALVNSLYDPDDAGSSADAAAQSAAAALVSEENAAISASAAAQSADDAALSAQEAADSAASIDLSALNQDIIPDTDGTRDLGSSANRFAEVHADDVYVENDLDVTGNVTIDGTLTVDGAGLTGTLCAEFRHQVGYNVDGGTPVALSWQTRPINTEVADDIGITLSSNSLAIPSGNYKISCNSVHKSPHHIKLRIRKITGSAATLVESTVIWAETIQPIPIEGMFTLANPHTIELQYYIDYAVLNTGLGEPSGESGMGDMIYAQILLEKY